MQHAKHLKAFAMSARKLPETDRLRVLELTARIFDEQEEPIMQELDLSWLSSEAI